MGEYQETIIEANRLERHYWRDLIRYRELFFILSWRDLKIRYKQTILGISWSVIRPLLTMAVFTIVFQRLAKLPVEGNAPYPIMVFAAMLPWQFFSNSLSEAGNSLVGNANLISKVYFPRIIIPISTIVTSLVDFLISLVILVVMMIYYSYSPGWNILFFIPFLVLSFAFASGTSLLVTALNVKYRDFRYIIPFVIQFGLYISPVGFSSALIPEKWKTIYALNPMVAVIEGFRWCITGAEFPSYTTLGISIASTLFFLFVGIRTFRKMEKTFADII